MAAGVHAVALAQAHGEVNAGTLRRPRVMIRYMSRVQKLSAYLLMQEMDSVLFANFDNRGVQNANGKARGVGGK